MTESGKESSGSVNPKRGPEWVTMAVLGKPRGTKGQMFALPYTNHWERFREGRVFRVWFQEAQRASREVSLEDAWSHNGKLILKFAEANSIDEAEELRGGELCIHESEREPLPEGEFYYDDLKGLTVKDAETGDVLGEVIGFTEGVGPGVVDVRSTGAQCLKGEGTEEWQIPFAKEICRDIDLERRELRVKLPAGLRELNRP
jgi:16S rRNA processing protein RimM